MKVTFAIPSITGSVRLETLKSLYEAFEMLDELGIERDLITLSGCPCLSVARDTLAAGFLADKDATDLFFIDYDLGFDPLGVVKILQRPEEIVAGAYRFKVDDRIEYSDVLTLVDGTPVGKIIGHNLALLEAEYLSTGFMRIKREALDQMQRAYPELRYEEKVIKMPGRDIQEAYDLFGMGVDQRRLRFTTEDYYFCQRWRDIGGKLWIYPDIQFDHYGTKAYSGNFHEHLLGNMILKEQA